MRRRDSAERARRLNERGVEEVNQKRYAEAEESFRQAIEAWPDFAGAWDNLGVALLHQGRYFEALFTIMHALELNPGEPDYHYNIGLLLAEHGQEMAIEQFQMCLQADPDYADAAFYLGMLHYGRNERDTAHQYFERVLEPNPEDTRAWIWLAREAFEGGDFEKAINLCQKVLDLDPSPSDPEVYIGLGHSYAGLGDYERAGEYFERYVTASPYDPYGHYLLACVYATRGENDLALQSIEDALLMSKEEVREWARDDPRLESLRSNPRFRELMGDDN